MDAETIQVRVVVSGASGLVGRALRRALMQNCYEVLQLVRSKPNGTNQLQWNPSGIPRIQEPSRLEGCEAAIHLSGASIAGRRWTAHYRQVLVESRVESTAVIARELAELKSPPKALIVASAIGIYGNRGDEILDETSKTGSGFLPGLCKAWEEATLPAEKAGIRVVHARFGIVLAKESGALAKMLPAFRLGLGGRLGTGRQWMSWISLTDAVDALLFLLAAEEVAGPVNLTAPNPVTNTDFTLALARQLGRPSMLPVPETALKLAFGTMANETLLASQRVMPSRLISANFRFRHSVLNEALRVALE